MRLFWTNVPPPFTFPSFSNLNSIYSKIDFTFQFVSLSSNRRAAATAPPPPQLPPHSTFQSLLCPAQLSPSPHFVHLQVGGFYHLISKYVVWFLPGPDQATAGPWARSRCGAGPPHHTPLVSARLVVIATLLAHFHLYSAHLKIRIMKR